MVLLLALQLPRHDATVLQATPPAWILTCAVGPCLPDSFGADARLARDWRAYFAALGSRPL